MVLTSISGEHVYVESGVHVDISGQPIDISGAYLASGQFVLISGQHVFVESGLYVVADVNVEVSSGIFVDGVSGVHVYVESGAHVEISGATVAVLGMDYIKSGVFPACSGTHGQLEMPTVMKELEPAHPISGWWACAEETRLFVGSDDKHIRFHDTFQAKALDARKWETGAGTPTVANGYCSLVNADIISRERVLYGTLSITVWSSNYQNVAFGFGTTNYPQGGDSIVELDGARFETQNVGTNATTSTDIPVADLTDNIWYDIDIVWTPSYAQFWVNGQLKVTHTTNIPSSPANIFFNAAQGIIIVANVSLKPYGDLPLTHRGAIPIAGGYYGTSGLLDMEFRPIRVCASGEIVICSGAHVVADVAVEVSSGLFVDGVSGIHVYQESGAFVTTQPNIGVSGTVTVESGLGVLISGQHVYQESGTFVTAEIIGGDTRMKVDSTARAGVQITTPHHKIHEGTMWHSWCRRSGLADNGILDMLIVTGSGVEIHLAPDGSCGGDAWFELYEGVTISDNGTLITPNCMNRTTSGIARTLTYCEPTVTSSMHPLTKQFMTGGQKKEATGGIIRPNTEWIFNGISGSMNYLIRVVNVATAAKDASVGIEFYEVTPGYI